jgi:4a-hydroxytetrahydrobiopterin dehydratase
MPMSPLEAKHCAPCEGKVAPLTHPAAQKLLRQVENWRLSPDGAQISRSFAFKDFCETMSFVNAVAWVANREGHHPDMQVGYSTCTLSYSTHAISGLSENDFICAAKINALLEG